MKKTIFVLLPVFVLFCFLSIASAVQVELTLESYSPATLPTVSTIIDLADINDQLEISRQAALFALSSQGWNLTVYDGSLEYNGPPYWSGQIYIAAVSAIGQDYNFLKTLFGYELNQEAWTYGPVFGLVFHTDELVERLAHNIGEPSGFGVITGTSGGIWAQCMVQNWGSFYITEISSVPEPATMFLLGLGIIGLAGIRRKVE